MRQHERMNMSCREVCAKIATNVIYKATLCLVDFMWIFRAMLGRMILRCCWRGFSSALLGARLSERTRAGRVPASYPTASTRRLMSPIADARTDHKIYADCHRDCRNNDYNINKQDDGCKRGRFPPVFSPGFPASSS